MNKTVALLVGGWSAEREVSLFKGDHIEKALIEAGYTVKKIDVTRDLQKLLNDLTPRPDVVFNNLYGRGGEDGIIQGVLEMLGIPYTHSGVAASAIGMDKILTKRLAASVGVKSAEGRLASREEIMAETVMPRPYVVKPYNEGSSVGVHIMFENENQPPLNEETWAFGEVALVEKYVGGREIHVAVLDGKAQGVTEIFVPGRFFDYDAKYKSDQTRLETPAQVPDIVAKTAMDYAEKVFDVLGCAGLARCDFRYDEAQSGFEGVYFLEINTMPGFSPGSIALIQPEMNGITYAQLCSHLVETAQCQDKVTADPSSKSALTQKSA
jgi:D-alanine-D-alanine ligase